jgi:general secretion pathway protein E
MLGDIGLDETADERLCAHLVRTGLVDRDALERVDRLRPTRDERLPALLTKLGLIAESDLATAMAEALGVPLVSADDFPDARILETVSPRFLKEARILPIADEADALVVAMADPTDDFALRALQSLVNKPVFVRLARPVDLEAAISRLYGHGRTDAGEVPTAIGDDDAATEDVSRLKDMASEAPVVRLVNSIVNGAVEAHATDIHIEPFDKRIAVRYRIDGLLRDVVAPPFPLRAAIASRIKIMAKLNIAERRLPQDGRIRSVVRGKEIDLRVSTVPTVHGESIVMRVLDRRAAALDFPALGYDSAFMACWRRLLGRPNGIILVTGPTGSGKTTTLYASLAHLNTTERKIVTVEDPVEYQLEGINQIQVKSQIGLSFTHTLRAILRQDPDVMMVGEIRDLETAEIAIQAALTGHLVLSTLHTNDAPSTVLRLLDMGVPDYLLASTINGILAQRLVRTLCADCAVPAPIAPEAMAEAKRAFGEDIDTAGCHAPRGCPSCGHTGFRGRTAIAELLVVDEVLRRAIVEERSVDALRRAAAERGMRTLLEDGLGKVLAGVTTFDEVARVTHDARP